MNYLVVSSHLKNISHIGNLPQVAVSIKKYLEQPTMFESNRLYRYRFLNEMNFLDDEIHLHLDT